MLVQPPQLLHVAAAEEAAAGELLEGVHSVVLAAGLDAAGLPVGVVARDAVVTTSLDVEADQVQVVIHQLIFDDAIEGRVPGLGRLHNLTSGGFLNKVPIISEGGGIEEAIRQAEVCHIVEAAVHGSNVLRHHAVPESDTTKIF